MTLDQSSAQKPASPVTAVLPVTVVVLAKNEEALIKRCLSSVGWAAEVLVMDSGSTDQTVEIAKAMGARVEHQPWLGWSPQRNRGAELAQNDWILVLEADEIVTDELEHSLRGVFAKGEPDPRNGYAVDRRGDFLGVLLPNPSRPTKRRAFVRFYNRLHSHYDVETLVHEEVLVPGQRIELPGVLLHWRGMVMDEYANAFNRYATIEAQDMARRGIKVRFWHLVFQPMGRFGWNYFVKGGWRFGIRGFIEAWLKGMNEFLRYAKLWEAQNQGRELHPPDDLYPESRYR